LVITARHCVAAAPESFSDCSLASFGDIDIKPGGLVLTTRTNLDDGLVPGAVNYKNKSVFVPANKGYCGTDIALVILDKNVPASEAIPATPALNSATAYGTALTAVGYGFSSPGALGTQGIRRVREKLGFVPLSPSELYVAEGGVCQADSGSNAFAQESIDNWKAGKGSPITLGPLSRGLTNGAKCTDAVYTRLDAHAAWIKTIAIQAAQEGGYPVPAWAQDASGAPGSPGAPGSSSDAGAPPPGAQGADGSVPPSGTDPASVDGGANAAAETGNDGAACQVAFRSAGGGAWLGRGLVVVHALLLAARRRRREAVTRPLA
jgi:hypothetical protein